VPPGPCLPPDHARVAGRGARSDHQRVGYRRRLQPPRRLRTRPCQPQRRYRLWPHRPSSRRNRPRHPRRERRRLLDKGNCWC
jgi:hypothetical protein